MAIFRRAMLEEQIGNWEGAKNLLESIPVLYPDTRAALEAPLAIVSRYVRARDSKAAQAAVERAIATYESLASRDSTSTYAPLYRWNLFRCQVTLGNWKEAIGIVEDMARAYPEHPVVAQALLEGAQLANRNKDRDAARRLLSRFVVLYPKSPLISDVRRELDALGPPPAVVARPPGFPLLSFATSKR